MHYFHTASIIKSLEKQNIEDGKCGRLNSSFFLVSRPFSHDFGILLMVESIFLPHVTCLDQKNGAEVMIDHL